MEKPEIKEIANEPFEEKIGEKPFSFRNIGMGRALSTISSWVLKTRRDEIRDNSQAFTDSKEQSIYVREELTKLPKGSKLSEAALVALCGDKEFMDSDGKAGQPPSVDEDLMVDLILRGFRGAKPNELKEVLLGLTQTELVKLSLRIMGIRTERDGVIEEAGGTAPKKAS